MKALRIFPIIAIVVAVLAACGGRQGHYSRLLAQAEIIARENPDSVLSILEGIEPSEIRSDSLRAAYYYTVTRAHKAKNSPAVADSSISFSFEFYKDKDPERAVACGVLYAWQMQNMGNPQGAFSLLDSMSSLAALPDSLMVELLKMRENKRAALKARSERQAHQYANALCAGEL